MGLKTRCVNHFRSDPKRLDFPEETFVGQKKGRGGGEIPTLYIVLADTLRSSQNLEKILSM